MMNDMDTNAFGLGTLTHVMTTAGLRHRVIAQNIANVNTPHYQRLEVSFGSELTRVLRSEGSSSTPLPAPQVVEAPGPERVDGNTVDIDREMAEVTKNALLYQAAVQIMASRISTLRSAITGR